MIHVECKYADTPGLVIVMSEMEIGKQKHSRMIRGVDDLVQVRGAMHNSAPCFAACLLHGTSVTFI